MVNKNKWSVIDFGLCLQGLKSTTKCRKKVSWLQNEEGAFLSMFLTKQFGDKCGCSVKASKNIFDCSWNFAWGFFFSPAMMQKNLRYKTERKICRRPKFVSQAEVEKTKAR